MCVRVFVCVHLQDVYVQRAWITWTIHKTRSNKRKHTHKHNLQFVFPEKKGFIRLHRHTFHKVTFGYLSDTVVHIYLSIHSMQGYVILWAMGKL